MVEVVFIEFECPLFFSLEVLLLLLLLVFLLHFPSLFPTRTDTVQRLVAWFQIELRQRLKIRDISTIRRTATFCDLSASPQVKRERERRRG